MKVKTLELKAALEFGKKSLNQAGIDDAETDAFILLSYVTKIDRTHYYIDPSRRLDEMETEEYISLINKRKQRIPVQHLTNEQEYMG
ncbi:MAG: peptide chain release factor N(5)-glutamine methyltransferase, partial [Suipraeoptans sp.]